MLLLVDALDFTILIVSDGRGHAGLVDFATRLGGQDDVTCAVVVACDY